MATVNLGSIKFNWQGAYDNATAYAVDDVVSSGGNSYICIAATTGNTPPNATYWELMAQAGTNGTNGTDVGTVITTQGDILYRDGSGLQRLGAGVAGQVLQTGGAGANPTWGDVTTTHGQVVYATDSTARTTTSTSYVTGGNTLSVTITPTSASSKIKIEVFTALYASTGDGYLDIYRNGSTQLSTSANGFCRTYNGYRMNGSVTFIDEPATTSATTYQVYFKADSSYSAGINYSDSTGVIVATELLI